MTVTDANATISGGPIASLAVGASDNSTFTGFHTLTQAEIDNGGVFNVATATGKDPKDKPVTTTSIDPTPLSPTDPNYPVTPPTPACPSCTVTPIVHTGAMTLAKDGSYNDFNTNGKVDAGDRINYTFVVTNTGNVTLTNVTVTDANATISGGPIASLAVGASDNSTFTGFHTLTQAEIDNGGVFNVATATGKDPKDRPVTTTSVDPTPLSPTDPNYPVTPPTPACPSCTVTPIVHTGAMTLAKDGSYNDFNTNGKVDAGDRINYTFVVTNTGNVTLTDVTVTDANATISGGPIASLAVGASDNSTFTGFHTLTQAEIDNGGVFNVATATGKDPKDRPVTTTSVDPTPLSPTDPNYPVTPPTPACPSCTVTPIVHTGAMTLAKDGSYNDFNTNGKVDAGDRINYTFVVTNTGNVTLTDVTVTDANATISGGPIASLAVGASDNSTFTGFHTLTQAEIDNGGVFNVATVTGKDPKNNNITTTSVDPTPLSPTDPNYPVTPPTPACPGCTVTPIVYTPSMSLAKSVNGTVPNTVGAELKYNLVLTNTGNVTLSNIAVSDANAVVTGSPIASLAPGASVTLTAVHTMTQSDLDGGSVTNQAKATGKDPKGNGVDKDSDDPSTGTPDDPTVTIIPAAPSMSLAKSVNGTVPNTVGAELKYNLIVTNTGNVTLNNIAVSDANAVVTGSPVASLAPGASVTLTAVHTMTQSDLDGGSVTNQAKATGKDPKGSGVDKDSDDPSTGTPDDSTVTIIPAAPSMSLAKSVNGTVPNTVGAALKYNLVLTNTGNVTLSNIAVSDVNAVVTGSPVASLAPGASVTLTAVHTMTQSDLDGGSVTNQAKATGKDPKGNGVDKDSDDPSTGTPDDPTVTIIPAAPSMSFAKSVNGTVPNTVGAALKYNLIVTNTGNVTLNNIAVSDANAVVTGSPVTSLAPGASVTLTAVHTMTQSDLDGGSVTNQAKATGKDPKGNGVDKDSDDPSTGTPDDPTVTVIPAAPSMSLAKSVNGTVPNTVGAELKYNLVVTNTGNVTLSNIAVSDANAVVTGSPVASLAPGASVTLTAVHTMTQSDLDGGSVTNQAKATGKDPKGNGVDKDSDDPSTGTPDDPTVTIIPAAPSMSLAKSVNGTVPNTLGAELKYNLIVTNTGNVTLSNIAVSDANAVVTGSPVASLAPGASVTLTAVHTMTQSDLDGGSVTNQAKATGKDPKGNGVDKDSDDPSTGTPDDPTVTVIPAAPSMSLAKSVNGTVPNTVGAELKYNLVLTNTGNVTLNNIAVSDANAVVTGSPVASLAPGASVTLTAVHTMTQADLDGGSVINQAKATGKDPKGNGVDKDSDDPSTGTPDDPTVTIIPAAPSMSLAKSVNGTVPNTVGAELKYNLVLTNTGNVTLSNVAVSDANAIVTGSPVASLAPGASVTLTAVHTMTQSDLDGGRVTNQAKATGKDPKGNGVDKDSDDPSTATPDDPTVTIIPAAPSMSLTKTATNVATKVGDVINYKLIVTNTGNVTLKNVTITDAKADPGSIIPLGIAVLQPGAQVTVTARHTLTLADVNSGRFANQATASGTDPKGGTVVVDSDDPSTPAAGDPTVTIITAKPAISLVKSGVLSTDGNNIVYTFKIRNTGNVELAPVTLTDNKLSLNVIVATRLEPAAEVSYQYSYLVSQADRDNGKVENTAEVIASSPSGDKVTDRSGTAEDNDQPTQTLMPQRSSIALVKTAVVSGNSINYTFTITNTGMTTLTSVRLNDAKAGISGLLLPLPTGLLPGQSISHSVVYKLSQADRDLGSVSNTAKVDALTPEGTHVGDVSGSDSTNDKPTVTPVTPSPVAVDDVASTKANQIVKIPVLGNDDAKNSGFDLSSIEITAQPKNGTLKINSDGTISYEPRAGYTGGDEFTYRVKDKDGYYTNIASVKITADFNAIKVPNLFTPNGDGINDTFEIIGLNQYQSSELTIVNRWGNEVFHAKGYNNTWTGEGLNEGTYFYLLRVKRTEGSEVEVFKGYITLIRAFKK
ncbi:hypothetical protein SRABI27_05150 [Pedobacter sp. Bi27]|nr:hypothetical protein SRABI27_05150 [Pedobacter sp. Bi27]